MKRKIALLIICVSVFSLYGCVRFIGPEVPVVPDTSKATITRVSEQGRINPILFDKGNDWRGVPLEPKIGHLATSFDQYGNPAGLSDDNAWRVIDVKIKIDSKATYDSVFTPMAEWDSDVYSVYGIENSFMWFPYWTGRVEGFTKLPYAPFPGVGRYPYACNTAVTPDAAPSGWGSIYVEAKTENVRVRVVAPPIQGAAYKLDMPGKTWQGSNEFVFNVSSPGDVRVLYSAGENDGEFVVTVPADWFYISEEFRVEIMPASGCNSAINMIVENNPFGL